MLCYTLCLENKKNGCLQAEFPPEVVSLFLQQPAVTFFTSEYYYAMQMVNLSCIFDGTVELCSGTMRTHWYGSTACGLCGTCVKAMNPFRSQSAASELAALLTAQTCSRWACSSSSMGQLASPRWFLARPDSRLMHDSYWKMNDAIASSTEMCRV